MLSRYAGCYARCWRGKEDLKVGVKGVCYKDEYY